MENNGNNPTYISFSCLCIREIIDFLIGDKTLPAEDYDALDVFSQYHSDKPNYETISLPYLTKNTIDDLFLRFGSEKPSYSQFKDSRWQRMELLINRLDKQGDANKLILYLFSKANLSKERARFSKIEFFEKYCEELQRSGIEYINQQLYLSNKELVLFEDNCYLMQRAESSIIKSCNAQCINFNYIKDLPKRIEKDLNNRDFDSVITKCRTLIEEVLIFIISQHNVDPCDSGNINTLSQQCKKVLSMNQKNSYDKRVNALLGGLEKIVDSIAGLRNINSDAHGAGQNRIEIKKREAVLMINSTITYCEYILAVHLSHKKE